MKIHCPSCSALLPAGQLNVETDVAVCGKCNEVLAISDMISTGQAVAVDLWNPPRGAWFKETFAGWKIGATTRSAVAFFLVPFTCVWSGLSLAGIYGSQIVKGEFDLTMSLFGIPFLIGSVVLISLTIMCIGGKVEVTVENNVGRIFLGVGMLGRTREFDWDSIVKVEEDYLDDSRMAIFLVGATRLKVCNMLTESRGEFLLQGLRKQLAGRDA